MNQCLPMLIPTSRLLLNGQFHFGKCVSKAYTWVRYFVASVVLENVYGPTCT